MGKIVGKFFAISTFIVYSIVLNAQVLMEVRPENGVRDQVVIGQPFVIDVIINDAYGSVNPPEIKGLDRFNAHRTGVYMSSINGKSTTRYSYQVRIDTIGTYTIGPAIVHHQQDKMVSNEVTINVVKSIMPASLHGKNSSHNQAKAFLRLMVNADSVVVGQKIECILRFYYQDPSLTLNKIGIPQLSEFDVMNMSNLESGVADLNGVSYRYAQWRWDMYPKVSGELIIPAYNIDYEVPLNDNRSLGGFFMLINTRTDHKRVYSNAVTINVLPLPPYQGTVDAIGVFERITVDIKPGMVKEGEGMILTLEVEGIGNLDAIKTPLLTMPEGLKYYNSQHEVIVSKNSDELPKKKFEFIVQGVRPGDWEIPEQIFTYFDIEKNKYVVLRTSSLVVSIMPAARQNKQMISEIADNDDDSPMIISLDQEIGSINSVGYWHCIQERQPLQWRLFFLLFFLLILYGFYPIMRKKIISLHDTMAWSRKRRAYKEARVKVEQACVLKNDENLYATFVQLLSSYGQSYSLESIADILRSRGFSALLIEEWNNFVNAITHTAYAKIDKNSGYANELCKAAKRWIDRLEKIL